jgi:hypothetical protein
MEGAEEEEPFAGERIVVLGEDGIQGSREIGVGGKISAQEELIVRCKERSQERQDLFRCEVGKDAEAGHEATGTGGVQAVEVTGQIGGGGEVTEHGVATVEG